MSSIGRRMTNKPRKNANDDRDEPSTTPREKDPPGKTPIRSPPVRDPKDQEDFKNAKTATDGTLVVLKGGNQEVLNYLQDIRDAFGGHGKKGS